MSKKIILNIVSILHYVSPVAFIAFINWNKAHPDITDPEALETNAASLFQGAFPVPKW